MSWRCLEGIFQDVLKMFWRRLEDVLKMYWRRFCKTSWRRLEDILKTSWRCLEDVWPRRMYWSWPRRLQDILKTSSEDVRLRRTYSSSWRRLLKTKTKDVFKTSLRLFHQDECLLGSMLGRIIKCFIFKQMRSNNYVILKRNENKLGMFFFLAKVYIFYQINHLAIHWS